MAYLFRKNDYSIGFSGDCTYTDNLENFVSQTDICFLECCSEKTTENHLGYDKFLDIKNRYPNNRYLAIHCVDRLYNNKDFDIEFAVSGQIYNFDKN